ncbi:enoyl-CoA hydratase/isomerase family protein [Vreelandella zhaodongensis]|uniref:Enoyl-CoA hydratase/isomerase family protein n=1 Tax=Vreelandella zhaodongensis TaxID=1176240 RepID=A0ABX2SS77_VREZH|nr:enoyl-CoA hydratase/isomerase family protein [Halomonas zhaodongensis]NYS44263.1 enoyl-CoA hydratase/isomerase family protein [Halomonas zhaodongensis]
MTACVTYQRYDRVGVICISNPPVNALSYAVRSGLMVAFGQAEADLQAKVLVLLAKGHTFIAGADINEFGKPARAPLLPDVILRIEGCIKPVIAVMHGTALGGGLEVALGCHLRVALPNTQVGLPEVQLGLMPGAGGTQRLPRLAGVETALDMMTQGRFLDAQEALASGIIDRLSETTDVLEAGLQAAQRVIKEEQATRVTRNLPAPQPVPGLIHAKRAQLEAEAGELFSPLRIVEAVDYCTTAASFQEGGRRERELFLACMSSPQRAALIHLFLAERQASQVPMVSGDVEPHRHIALLGEHPLFEHWARRANKVGIGVADRLLPETTLCLMSCCHLGTILPPQITGVAVLDLKEPIPEKADMTLITSSRSHFGELVRQQASAHEQQRAALTLKALKLPLIVSSGESLVLAMHTAIQVSPDTDMQNVLERFSHDSRLRAASYRSSDIDLLAVEFFAYPRHLGGPCYQASLAVQGLADSSSADEACY